MFCQHRVHHPKLRIRGRTSFDLAQDKTTHYTADAHVVVPPMYLLYCDESNLEPRDNDFFVYGGLVIGGEQAHSLSDRIDTIRRTARIPRDFLLKFNPGPANLDHAEFINVKQQVIEAAIEHGCIFLTSMILHNIATSPAEARRNEINRICYHYNALLHRAETHGLVLIDRFEDRQIDQHLREKFSTGVTGLPFSPELRLKRIVGFHYSAIGQSHFSSIIDIVLGSFRFAINAFTRNDAERLETAGRLLELLSPLFLRDPGHEQVSELSLFFSPKTVRSDRFLRQYTDLSLFFSGHGIVPAQRITNLRTY